LIKNYHNSIKLSDVLILTVDPNNLDSYASYAEWGLASKSSKTLYIIPKYGNKIPSDLWWFAMESILSINKLKDEKRIDYHMVILNSINPDIRSKKMYYHMLDKTTKHKNYNHTPPSNTTANDNVLLCSTNCKEWSIMNIHEKNAVLSIGISKKTWETGFTCDNCIHDKKWNDYTIDQKESLKFLGYDEDDFKK